MNNIFNVPIPSPVVFPVSSVLQLAIPLTLTLPLWITLYSAILQYMDFTHSRSWRMQDSRIVEEYDFIVVGGGSSGAAVANRLSRHSKVLLLELGGDPNPMSRLGISYFLLQRCPGTDLMYETEPLNNSALALTNHRVFWPRGTGIGGSSNLNAMIYQRGNPKDYDNWANITGNQEWRYENLLHYFKKLEDYHGAYPNDKLHGTGGPMHVEKLRQSYMDKYFLRAAHERGYPIKDLNGYQTEGFSGMEVTMKDALRWSTYPGYIKPIQQRKNLKIYRYSRVVKIHLDKNRHAYGITFHRHGLQRFVRARKEILISAGAIDTPKLLMLSGIGPMEALHRVGLKCRVNLLVGQNLQDHVLTLMGPFLVDVPESLILSRVLNLGTVANFARSSRSGALASTSHSAIGYVSSSIRKDPSWPDIQYTLNSFGIFDGIDEFLTNIFNIKRGVLAKYFWNENTRNDRDANWVGVALVRPKSVGEITLASRNPYTNPVIRPNYFGHKDDMRAMIDALKAIVDLYENTSVYRKINARLIEKPLPGCESHAHRSDAYYECYIRHLTLTIYHPVGTAAMGKTWRNGPVVDSELRVFKTSGLRVIDASIMPVLVNANTNIPCILIGEVGSMFIRRYWQEQYAICIWTEFLFNPDEHRTCYYSRIV